MNPSLTDRIVSILSYFTFGIFSIVWIIYANLTKKRIDNFLGFNLYQSIFISIAFAVISLIYQIAINFLSVVPFIAQYVKAFDLFFNQTPIYYSYTLSGFLTTIIIFYLSIFSLFGKKPFVPIVSDIVSVNFGG